PTNFEIFISDKTRVYDDIENDIDNSDDNDENNHMI
ncbi:unnamed protein product, partial [marine sediment metagenome]